MKYDSHCHLDLMNNMMSIVQEFKKENLGMLAVGTTPKAYLKEAAMCSNMKNIHVALGLHPQLVGSEYDDWELFELLAKQCHYIGEIGLDFSINCIATKNRQLEIFEKILRCCEQYNDKVVSVHSLRSSSTVIELLKKTKQSTKNIYILHWFTGSLIQIKTALELGCFFSINPKMLQTKSGIERIQNIPPQRILLETDAPFSIRFQNAKQLEIILQNIVDNLSILKGVDMKKYLIYNQERVFKYL